MNDDRSLLRRQSPVDHVRIKLPLVASVLDNIVNKGGQPVLVGGLVRDYLLGQPGTDIDIEVFHISSSDELKLLLSPLGSISEVGASFGVWQYSGPEGSVDFSMPRLEQHTGPSHTDVSIQLDASLTFEAAASRRDFSVNAMGIDWGSHQLLDPFNGQDDLSGRILRHISPEFSSDPLRLLRAFQFSSRFGLTPHQDTVQLCRTMSLSNLSKDRLFEELKKWLLGSPHPSVGLPLLYELGVIQQWPEMMRYYESDYWEKAGYAIDTMRHTPAVSYPLMLASWLVHAISIDPDGSEIIHPFLSRLTDSSQLVDPLVSSMVATHSLIQLSMNPGLTESDVILTAKTAKLRSIIAMIRGAYPDSSRLVRYLLSTATRLKIMDGPLPPMIKGRDLLSLGIPPGDHVHEILSLVYDAQLKGAFKTKVAALEFIKEWWANDSDVDG